MGNIPVLSSLSFTLLSLRLLIHALLLYFKLLSGTLQKVFLRRPAAVHIMTPKVVVAVLSLPCDIHRAEVGLVFSDYKLRLADMNGICNEIIGVCAWFHIIAPPCCFLFYFAPAEWL